MVVWQHARKMASIDHDLRDLTAVRFDIAHFQRLGQLQAELKRRNYR
jgi:hypothetical protein